MLMVGHAYRKSIMEIGLKWNIRCDKLIATCMYIYKTLHPKVADYILPYRFHARPQNRLRKFKKFENDIKNTFWLQPYKTGNKLNFKNTKKIQICYGYTICF